MTRQVGWWMSGLVACTGASSEGYSDTDHFAPDAHGAEVVGTHIPADLRGRWVVRVPKVLRRKFDILSASIEGRSADGFDPPLSDAERTWFDQAADPEHPYRAWVRCARSCAIQIEDSSFWNTGYYPYDRVGSSLVERPVIDGREVTFHLHEHDPNGMDGVVRIRMNREWTGFRVVDFDLEGYRDEHLPQKLELHYFREGLQ